jgi:uncharacterized protein YndB with AHSA1/START domain
MGPGTSRHPAVLSDHRHSLERRVYIARSPSDVWAALVDPPSWARIHGDIRFGAPLGAWPAAGSIRSARVRLGLLREDGAVESLEARPRQRLRYRLVAGAVTAEWSWTFEPTAGGTRAIHAVAGDVGDRVSGWLAGLGHDPLERALEAHLRMLKSIAESRPDRGAEATHG